MATLGCCGCPYHSSMIYTIGQFASWHLFGANIDPLFRIYQIFFLKRSKFDRANLHGLALSDYKFMIMCYTKS